LPPFAARALLMAKRLVECSSTGVARNATPRARVAADFENLIAMMIYLS
jgi:hypothetical protein